MLGTAMGSSLINVVWALLIGAVIFAVFNVGYFDSDSQEIEKIADQLYLDGEQAKRMAEELAREPTVPRENTYMEIERPLVASLVNSPRAVQIKVAIMTHDGDRVISNMKKHESNIRSEMLDVMRNVDESAISAPGFREDLAEMLKVATNSVLEKYEDFGGVEAVMFTEFEVQ